MDRGLLRQIDNLLRPLRLKVANLFARGVVHQANDGKLLQLLQVGALAGETIDDAEHHQPYGFASIPLAGAEVVLGFPNGDRSHPIVLAASDRRHRPVGGQGGEVLVYTDEGDVIRLGRGHIISLSTVGEVRLGSAAAAGDVVVQAALDDFMSALAAAISDLSATPVAAAALTALKARLLALNATAGWKARTSKTKAE